MKKDPTDGNIWIDVYARRYVGEERTTFSQDMLTVEEAIEYLTALKDRV